MLKTATAKASSNGKATAKKSSAAASNGKTATKKASPASSNGKASPAKTSAAKVPAKKDAAEELKEFLVEGLKDLYWAEKALVKSLPKMQKNATNEQLKSSIGKHLEQTKNQVTRLEACFEALGKKAQGKKCDAMEGILKEGDSILEETTPGHMRDVGIISAAQKVEHYEIASYGTLAAFAKVLKEKKCLDNLLATLEEEKQTDEHLTAIADTHLNSLAI